MIVPVLLIPAKVQRPPLPGDLIPRRRLVDRVCASLDRKLTLISAMAGTGKTTLMAQSLEQCPRRSVWLSLDDYDNDVVVFVSDLIAAVRTVCPGACEETLNLLRGAESPPLRAITASLVEELHDAISSSIDEDVSSSNGLILALDDYHYITDPGIDKLLSTLIEQSPPGIHVMLASRVDPQLPLSRWQARREMAEIRSIDLRFTVEEAGALLEATIGKELSSATVGCLEAKTDGWAVGLRLAALSIRTRPKRQVSVEACLNGHNKLIVDYLASEVLDQQPAEIRDFILHTSVLDRFCASLCEAVTGISAARSQEIIDYMEGANLFISPLDGWHRYHALFQDLLQNKLSQEYGTTVVSELHALAGSWFAQERLTDEAVHHFLDAGDTAAAVEVVARIRYELMNQARWGRLEHYVRQFSPDTVDEQPELLLTRTWLAYQQGRYGELPAAIERIEAALARTTAAPEAFETLYGEISALRSFCSILVGDAESSLAHAQHALVRTPRALWIVRLAARMCIVLALLLQGEVSLAYEVLYAGFAEEGDESPGFKATLLATACNIHWMTGDLPGLGWAAERILALSREPYSSQFLAWGHYHLGRVRYHQNDLAAAEEHFAAVVEQPYQSYGVCYIYSACGLALTHQAVGRPKQAREVTEEAIAFALESGNATLVQVILAFRAELALMQGQVATASWQAAHFDPVPPLSLMYGLFSLHLMLVKVWLAEGTQASRDRAAELLERVEAYCASNHITRFLIEALALRALIYDEEGDEAAALAALGQAVALAEPGGWVRLFVDLGPPLDRLLDRLRRQGASGYIDQVLTAFKTTGQTAGGAGKAGHSAPGLRLSSSLIEPLTPRELEVLALLDRHLTNREIADRLVVAPSTVKTHTLNIYGKLEVNSRNQAVARGKELGLI